MNFKQVIYDFEGFVKNLFYTYKKWSQSNMINFLQSALNRHYIVFTEG